MKINWKLRLQNKTTLVALASLIIGFVYQLLALFDVIPAVTQDSVMTFVLLITNVLAALGVIVDPTTKGFCDSKRALSYNNLKDDSKGGK